MHTKHLVSIALLLVVAVLFIRQGPKLLDALERVQLNWAVAGLGCYAVNYLLRSVRIYLLLKKKIRLWPDCVYCAGLHGFATYLMPLRSGDLTLPIILRSFARMDFFEGARVLLKARLLDLVSLGVWILIASSLVDIALPTALRKAWIIAGLGLIGLPLGIRLVAGITNRSANRILQQLASWGAIGALGKTELVISFGIWAAVGACFYCTTRSINLPLGFSGIWLLITIQLPLQLIPLQGIANAGNHEGGWVTALALLGVPTTEALNYALLSHALLLLYVLSLGPVALFLRPAQTGPGERSN
jgi:hypothetical protein